MGYKKMRAKIKDRPFVDALWGEDERRAPFIIGGWYPVIRQLDDGRLLVRLNSTEITTVPQDEILMLEADDVS